MISESPGPQVAARLLSVTLSNDRVDEEAKRFIEGRINLLIRNYESRLAKSLQSVCTLVSLYWHQSVGQIRNLSLPYFLTPIAQHISSYGNLLAMRLFLWL